MLGQGWRDHKKCGCVLYILKLTIKHIFYTFSIIFFLENSMKTKIQTISFA